MDCYHYILGIKINNMSNTIAQKSSNKMLMLYLMYLYCIILFLYSKDAIF